VPSGEHLSALLDPRDLDGSEQRLQAALAAETTGNGRAAVLTQLARLASWRDRFGDAQTLLEEADSIAGDSGEARARVLLERARVLWQTDGEAAAQPLAEAAFETALAGEAYFVAADAAHACALRGDTRGWTARGLEVAERHASAAYWRRTFLLNLGDWHWERGDAEAALAAHQASLAAAEQATRNPQLTEEARAGVGRALRALGRSDQAVPLLQRAVAWADENGYDAPEADAWRNELAAIVSAR
jgi:tetratricopeptide (TPR) repeat protein